MPIGDYPDFDACVADNQDMDDPEAFCAWLKEEIEGTSNKASKLTAEQVTGFEKYATTHGWQRRNGRLYRVREHKMETQTIKDVQIFATGVHNFEAYTEEDLVGMAKAFDELKGLVDPPLKIGHTSDEFNIQLAEDLGVPPEMITGDEYGQGAMALGWLDNVRAIGDKLVADFVNVPKPIAELIESKAFKKVSAEILWMLDVNGEVYKYVVSGVALLGAELPAVRDLDGLETVASFTYTLKPHRIVEFNSEDLSGNIRTMLDDVEAAVETVIKGKVGATAVRAFLKDVKLKVTAMLNKGNKDQKKYKEEGDDMKDILKALGLEETETEENAVAAIVALKENSGTELKEMRTVLELAEDADVEAIVSAIRVKVAGTSAESREFAGIKATNTRLESKVANLEKAGRLSHFTEIATKWGLISGTPQEFAERLVALEEKDSKEAEALVTTYNQTQAQLEAAGADRALGNPGEGVIEGDSEFEKEVKKYASENHVDAQAAFEKIREDRADLFRDFMKNRPRVYAKSPESGS